MAYVFKVSKPGYDAKTTGLQNLYINSNYPLLKVHSFGTFSTSIIGTKTITHSLGYKPFVLVFSQYVDDDGSGFGVTTTSEYYQHDWYQAGASVTFYGYTKITTSDIQITIGNTLDGGRPGVINGFYYIFKDEVA